MHHGLQLRIGPRLALSFAALLSLCVALAVLTSWRLEEASAALKRLADRQIENLVLVGEIGSHAEQVGRKLLLLMSAPREVRVEVYTEIDSAGRLLDGAVAALDKRLPDGPGRAELQTLQYRLQAYREAYNATIELIEAEDGVGARRMLVEVTEGALSALSGAREELSRSQQAATMQSAWQLDERVRQDRRVVALLGLLSVAAGGALAVSVTRRIVRPLKQAEAIAGHMAAGDYSRRASTTTGDEVAQLAVALNTLAEAVGEREARLLRLADTDAMTGLAQRARFVSEGRHLLAGAPPGGATLLCMDIDRLKLINAVLGFDAGDAVIADAAHRLADVLGPGARLGRLTGGTFVALTIAARADDGSAIAARVQAAVEQHVQWRGQTLDLSLTIGIARSAGEALDCEALLRHAEQAMFEAKRQRLRFTVYTPSLEAARLSHLSLLSELQQALAQGQLRQFVQPKVSPIDGRLHGVEALVRWQHPERGWVPPGEFIPFAESTGRIRDITQWMLEQAVRTLARWHAEGVAIPIAVNVSTLDLQDSALPQRVQQLLEQHSVPARLLQLELTETGLLTSGPDPIRVLHSLRDLGVRLAIDDFGTGQSSLAYLQRLPVHELKIDRSFVDGFDTDQRRRELLNSIVALGHSLVLEVTAEGVETQAELSALAESRCDLVQGYLIAKPMSVERFDAWRAAELKASPAAPLLVPSA